MSRIHIEAELPATTDERERVEAYATVIDAGLKAVASDPEMRLQMILGQFAAEFKGLCRRLAVTLLEDEDKAPGLQDAAHCMIYRDPEAVMRQQRLKTPLEAKMRQILLGLAAEFVVEDVRKDALPPPEIDGDGA